MRRFISLALTEVVVGCGGSGEQTLLDGLVAGPGGGSRALDAVASISFRASPNADPSRFRTLRDEFQAAERPPVVSCKMAHSCRPQRCVRPTLGDSHGACDHQPPPVMRGKYPSPGGGYVTCDGGADEFEQLVDGLRVAVSLTTSYFGVSRQPSHADAEVERFSTLLSLAVPNGSADPGRGRRAACAA
jgi:hypothetical protein